MERKNIAGMSMKGGNRNQFFLCLLDFYSLENRWFLRSILRVKDEKGVSGDDAIRSWIDKFNLKELVVDFPVSSPACQSCEIFCPGADLCPISSIQMVRRKIHDILEEDRRYIQKYPKTYERERNADDSFDFTKDIMTKKTCDHILGRPFKRRLKKGFLPYWNRPVDFWIWANYYDKLLKFFNSSYDSFGNTSIMVQSRFSYLKRHFPKGFKVSEGNLYIALLELLRSGIIHKKNIRNLSDIEEGGEARLDIIKKIETNLNIFIYDYDLEILVKNPRAFESFLMAVIGKNKYEDKNHKLPPWTHSEETNFIIPSF